MLKRLFTFDLHFKTKHASRAKPRLVCCDITRNTVYGAMVHTATETINFLLPFIGDRLISKVLWPLRNPDLTPPDFSLGPYEK